MGLLCRRLKTQPGSAVSYWKQWIHFLGRKLATLAWFPLSQAPTIETVVTSYAHNINCRDSWIPSTYDDLSGRSIRPVYDPLKSEHVTDNSSRHARYILPLLLLPRPLAPLWLRTLTELTDARTKRLWWWRLPRMASGLSRWPIKSTETAVGGRECNLEQMRSACTSPLLQAGGGALEYWWRVIEETYPK